MEIKNTKTISKEESAYYKGCVDMAKHINGLMKEMTQFGIIPISSCFIIEERINDIISTYSKKITDESKKH